MAEPKWIEFDLFKEGDKTSIWLVRSIEGGFTLGFIKWHAPWRRYCFEAAGDTIFEEVCMRNIADFIETKTKEHYEKLKKK